MADDSSFLQRWSRRKHEAARVAQPAPEAVTARPQVEPPLPAVAAGQPAAAAPTPLPAEAPPLPPVESLTLESDFAPFLSAKVDEAVKRAAMRKLFSDPRFNVMDGLDIYIDDYSKPDPMPEGMLERLADVYKTIEEKIVEPSAPEAAAIAAETTAAPVPEATAEPGSPLVDADQTNPTPRTGSDSNEHIG
jgi:hypothetical protein